MSFRIIYTDNADVVADEPRYVDALRRLSAFLRDHRDLAEQIGIQEIDSRGFPLGPVILESESPLPVAMVEKTTSPAEGRTFPAKQTLAAAAAAFTLASVTVVPGGSSERQLPNQAGSPHQS